MSTIYHTPILAIPNQLADAALWNSRFSSLDSGIDDAMSFGVNNNAELAAARDTYASLDARLDAIGYAVSGSAVWTLTNGAASAGQKVVVVDSTVGFIAGAYVVYTLVGGVVEYNAIDTVDSTTQLTLDTNIGTGGIANDTSIAMTAVFTQTTPGGILVPEIAVGGITKVVTVTTADPDETDFAWTIDSSNVSNSVRDTGMAIGYNVGTAAGSRADATKAKLALIWEATWKYSPTLSRTEFYIECIQPAAAGAGTIRPYMINLEHQSDYLSVAHEASWHHFADYGAGTGQMDFYPSQSPPILRLTDTSIVLGTNNVWFLQQSNAAASATINVLKVNASNQIEIGGSTDTIYIPGSQTTTGTISSGNGGLSTLQDVLIFFNDANFPTTYRHEIKASASYGGVATESLLAFDLTDATASGHKRPLLLRGDNRAIIGAPATTIEDAGLAAGNISFWLDESGNTLTVKAKYSGGTVKSGTVALA